MRIGLNIVSPLESSMQAGDDRWHEVFERDQGHCRYCSCDLLASFEHYYFAEVDHLLPQSAPDRDELKNLVLACRACNGRLSRAHSLGHTTFEARRNYLRQDSLSLDTRKMYEHYLARRQQGWG